VFRDLPRVPCSVAKNKMATIVKHLKLTLRAMAEAEDGFWD